MELGEPQENVQPESSGNEIFISTKKLPKELNHASDLSKRPSRTPPLSPRHQTSEADQTEQLLLNRNLIPSNSVDDLKPLKDGRKEWKMFNELYSNQESKVTFAPEQYKRNGDNALVSESWSRTSNNLMDEDNLASRSLTSLLPVEEDLVRDLTVDRRSIFVKQDDTGSLCPHWMRRIASKFLGRNTMNVHSKEFAQTSLKREVYELAAVWVRDAMHIRPHNRRLLQRGEIPCVTPISAYQFTHNSFWSVFVNCCIWFHMFLAIWEPPVVPEVPAWILWSEAVILLIYCLDIRLKKYSHDPENFGDSLWTMTFVLIIGINFFAVVIVASLKLNYVTGIYKVTRVLRPYSLVWKQKDLRKMIISIVQSIPLILTVAMLVAGYTLLFAFAGFELFRTDNTNFSSLLVSMRSLFVLLTTANYPDVMMPSYHVSWASAFYFVVFLVFGLYFLMALILAVVYDHFSLSTKRTEKQIRLQRNRTMDAIFNLLATWKKEKKPSYRGQQFEKKELVKHWSLTNKTSRRSSASSAKEGRATRESQVSKSSKQPDEGRIFQNVFLRLICAIRSNITRKHASVLYFAMCFDEKKKFENGITRKRFHNLIYYIGVWFELEKSMDLKCLLIDRKLRTQAKLFTRLSSRRKSSMTVNSGSKRVLWPSLSRKNNLKSQLLSSEICESDTPNWTMNTESTLNLTNSTNYDMDSLGANKEDEKITDCCRWCCDTVIISYYRLLGWYLTLRRLIVVAFGNKLVSRSVNFMIWTGTICILFQTADPSSSKTDPGEYTALDWAGKSFLYLFLIEVCLRLIGYGYSYLTDWMNLIDFTVVIISFVTDQLVKTEPQTFVVIFRLLRVFRLVRGIRNFKVIVRTAFSVLPSFFVLGMIQFCVIYIFAIIGMQLFYGKVSEDAVKAMIVKYQDDKSSGDYKYWAGIQDAHYGDNNMNDFKHAVIVLFELMVVNNWMVIYGMYVRLTNAWTYIYFYLYYLISVVVVVNVVIAFVVDAFITQYARMETELSDGHPEWEVRVREALRMVFSKTSDHWQIRRKQCKALFYDSLFGDSEEDDENEVDTVPERSKVCENPIKLRKASVELGESGLRRRASSL